MAELFTHSLFNDANLVAYWRFESGALTTDSKGSYTLTNNNTVGESSGIYGGCADFGNPNTNKYFSRASEIIAEGSSFTINCWVKNTTIQIISANYDTSNEHYIFIGNTGFTWQSISTAGVDSYAESVTIDTSRHFCSFVLSFSGGNSTKSFYLDGKVVGTPKVLSSATPRAWQNPIYLGKTFIEPNYGVGLLDDCSIFTRALSATEIMSLYQDTGGSFLLNFV